MAPGEKVEVESCDAHDGVVGVTLIWYCQLCGSVPQKGEVVVARVKACKEGRRHCKEWGVLNVWIVFLQGCQCHRSYKTRDRLRDGL